MTSPTLTPFQASVKTAMEQWNEALKPLAAAFGRFWNTLADALRKAALASPATFRNPEHRAAVVVLGAAVDDTEEEMRLALMRGRLQAKRVFDIELTRLRHRLALTDDTSVSHVVTDAVTHAVRHDGDAR